MFTVFFHVLENNKNFNDSDKISIYSIYSHYDGFSIITSIYSTNIVMILNLCTISFISHNVNLLFSQTNQSVSILFQQILHPYIVHYQTKFYDSNSSPTPHQKKMSKANERKRKKHANNDWNIYSLLSLLFSVSISISLSFANLSFICLFEKI